jgi:hypothetical protein
LLELSFTEPPLEQPENIITVPKIADKTADASFLIFIV